MYIYIFPVNLNIDLRAFHDPKSPTHSSPIRKIERKLKEKNGTQKKITAGRQGRNIEERTGLEKNVDRNIM